MIGVATSDAQRRRWPALRPRLRFFLLLMPRIITGTSTPLRLTAHSLSLADDGNERLAAWCWARAMRSAARDEYVCEAVIRMCVASGRPGWGEAMANRFFDECGVYPAMAVALAGRLALAGRFDGASNVYRRLLRQSGEDVTRRSPSPIHPDTRDAGGLGTMLSERAAGRVTVSTDLELRLARLCFSFAAFDEGAELFDRAATSAAWTAEDRIGHAYALLRGRGANCISDSIQQLAASTADASLDPDWQMLLATVLFSRGAVQEASMVVEAALRQRFAGHAELDLLVDDCRRIVACLSRCGEVLTFRAETTPSTADNDGDGMHKIFVCGHGWSGSGAVYAALLEHDCFSEPPAAPADAHLNADTGDEMMFVQGPAGFGILWREARISRRLSRMALWDMFRCHVSGCGAIGYAEHKSANAARHWVTRIGHSYTTAFLRVYEGIEALPLEASNVELQRLLTLAIELLVTSMFPKNDSGCVVLNNAVFARNVDMLEMFRNYKAVCVVRDPRDQYADRKTHDLKQWMTARRFVDFYRDSLALFRTGIRQLPPRHRTLVREVSFERFVTEPRYRRHVLDWLLERCRPIRRTRNRFAPEQSSKNIGIHASILATRERRTIEAGLRRWCKHL